MVEYPDRLEGGIKDGGGTFRVFALQENDTGLIKPLKAYLTVSKGMQSSGEILLNIVD